MTSTQLDIMFQISLNLEIVLFCLAIQENFPLAQSSTSTVQNIKETQAQTWASVQQIRMKGRDRRTKMFPQ